MWPIHISEIERQIIYQHDIMAVIEGCLIERRWLGMGEVS